jgi:hypothetical protein
MFFLKFVSRTKSVGLFNDKHLLVSSRWFEASASPSIITAGSTLGMLCYYPAQGGLNDSITCADSEGTVSGENVISKLLRGFIVESGPSSDVKEHNISPDAVCCSNDSNKFHGDFPSSFVVQFNVDGTLLDFSDHAQLAISEITNSSAPLYPTVSITSEGTRVWCRLCEADIVYRTHAAIGSRPGSKVYALDGSVLIDDSN